MGHRSTFRYLSEADCIEAGVLDAARCVDVCEEVFGLLADGDYLLGGPNHNSHGMGIVFPKETAFPNMPVAGPDRRFFAMPGYLGGRFDLCGNKWYGSNHANLSQGLPRSVLTVMLNDKDTGEPLSLLSANLISSARTGAVPGVGARYLAREDSQVIAVLGCGPINRACFTAIYTQLPKLSQVICYDIDENSARDFTTWANCTYGINAVVEPDLQMALRPADVVTVAASRVKPLVVEDSWFAPGATILVTGPITADEAFWTGTRIVYDHIGLHEAYVEEALSSGDKDSYYSGVIGGPIYRLIDAGKLAPLTESTDLGRIVRGGEGRRRDTAERIAFIACGMSVFDLAWSYDLYRTALEKDLGQELVLWDEPYRG